MSVPAMPYDPPIRRIVLLPVRAWSVVSAVLIAVTTAMALIVAWATWDSYFVAQRFLWDDPAVSADDLYAADDRTTLLALIYLFALAISGVVFITWLYRARKNAELLCDAEHRRSRGWLIGGWFVPIVNLWFPFQIVSDIWKASSPTTPKRLDALVHLKGSGLVALWWGCMATGTVIDRIAPRLIDMDNPTIEQFHAVAVAETISLVLMAAAGVLVIMVMRQIVRWQEQARTPDSLR
ncbi:DUF4328 domain-containing protein [Actinokineospora sp. HUAS TT18]|uniref:DUF4328 domain-containing protein n=1 Tax=Actinokineospora sp. HUAS TT18 TaxID=3447451 RepID=UPI003F521C1D